jgi:transcriptional regulator with XRE-family HTH domain
MNSIFEEEPTPNKFTISMGERIRQAREDLGLSQAELAKKIFRRRATVSDIENGKSEVGTITLSRLSSVLNKPISYFFPEFAIREHKPESISQLSKELLIYFDSLYDENLKQTAIKIIRSLSEYDPTQSIYELLELTKDEVIANDKIIEYLESKIRR